jgi:hypothetical protein
LYYHLLSKNIKTGIYKTVISPVDVYGCKSVILRKEHRLRVFEDRVLKRIFGPNRLIDAMLGGIPVPTAWRVLGLRMEERPPDMEVSCEYIE